ncbi:MAG: TIGR02680 family protein [Gallionellaceae bacterium]|nr:TIGR02680 family protein [Gallionellaceae bacterium]
MSEEPLFAPPAVPPPRPALPEPRRGRWQPLRLGLVELFHYDSEEFWFRDGHLLLRGNNGTGKSKVLSLTLPFLFDAQLRPSRIEPDGDSGKKMAWNLLMNSYQRRIGYAWIEFGRIAEDGRAHYLTLGAGLSAVAARAQVESWFFMLEDAPDGPRIGQDLWLTNSQRIVLAREHLREAITEHGQMFETAAGYRRAVDERLFHLGGKRYEALIDTLIQLRQPQLSRKPDEAGLSNALTEALPPMPQELLADVAEALNQLEEDRRQLEEFQQLARAVERFDLRYRVYAGTLTRRQARELRQAQTDFDNASRERNEAQTRLHQARAAEGLARDARERAELDLAARRTRLDTLLSDPAVQDANRLETAREEAAKRRRAAETARAAQAESETRLRREQQASRDSAERAELAEQALQALRREGAGLAETAGVAADFGGNPLAALAPDSLAELAPREFEAAQAGLRAAVAARREHLVLLRRRHAEAAQAETVLAQRRQAQRDALEDLEGAAERRAEADAAVERAGEALIEAWAAHCQALEQLRFDADASIAALTDWVPSLQGDNPAQQALLQAQHQASARFAARQQELDGKSQTRRQERDELEAERELLAAGRDAAPPAPPTRAADSRREIAGAPLWQLIDFHDQVDAAARAGLEAALEAAGLLDAWVTPDGALLTAAGGTPWLDRQWLARPRGGEATLAGWLRAAVPDATPVAAASVESLLASVACGQDDNSAAEAWIAPDGRFRLGSLAGAWAKPQAVYIGYAARAAARARRLDEIARRLEQLAWEQTEAERGYAQLAADREQAEREWRTVPSEQTLRQAHLAAAAGERDYLAARERLGRAEALCRAAEQAVRIARDALERDAADLRLPVAAAGLAEVEVALERFNDAHYRLAQAAQAWRSARPEWLRQQAREIEAQEQLSRHETQLAASRIEAEEAQARYQTLRDAVGVRVDDVLQQLAAAREAVKTGERTDKAADFVLRDTGEARARAEVQAEAAETTLEQRGAARGNAVARLQRFAESGLLAAALPRLELPDSRGIWTIEPALTLARRAEQALSGIQDDDATWNRVQRQTAEDLTELQRALGALGHQASAEPSDWGLVVHVVYQNRPERPDQLAARLADDIAQRGELLTAKEREVLENHLQAEIASEVQRLLRAAEKQVAAINQELDKRPTSTGVRYRLQWQPLGENEGAPVGLEAARQRLLNTSADIWTAEDRRVVGAMLQQRIAAERERADADLGRDDGGSLIDQLARALDYRRWHQFRVQRLQDGQWRKLSGPASSGERALGLTVPLFAAIASFYSQGCNPLAPRLILLDEAFAGIDDAARAHCMGLIREFDLDFVITSEREWACYAELPGVSICQLQRREGIDAVFVSRWSWDGQAKRREDDPDRRYASA